MLRPQAPLASPTTDDEAGGGAHGEGEGGEEGLGRGGAEGASDNGGAGDGCPQLVSFYDAYVNPTEGTVSIVQEYMDGGSLQVRTLSFCVFWGGCGGSSKEAAGCWRSRLMWSIDRPTLFISSIALTPPPPFLLFPTP
jgi:serine/threonine protein kinase